MLVASGRCAGAIAALIMGGADERADEKSHDEAQIIIGVENRKSHALFEHKKILLSSSTRILIRPVCRFGETRMIIYIHRYS